MKNLKPIDPFDIIFAQRLRLLMTEHSTKQTDLAEHLGLTRQAISKYADGSVLPNIENLQKICEFFNVSSDYMIGLSNSESVVDEERYCSDFTGLNTNSIKVLNSISNHDTEEEKILQKLLNSILINKDGLIILAKKIIGCYNAYVVEHNDNISSNDTNTGAVQFDYRTSRFLACDWFDDIIEDIVLTMYEEKRGNNGNKNK